MTGHTVADGHGSGCMGRINDKLISDKFKQGYN